MAIPAKVPVAGSKFLSLFIDKRGTGFSLRFMHMMIEGVVLIGPVTLGTQGIPFKFPFQAVRIMAIAATYILHVHLTLCKRAVFIIFIQELPIDKVIRVLQATGEWHSSKIHYAHDHRSPVNFSGHGRVHRIQHTDGR